MMKKHALLVSGVLNIILIATLLVGFQYHKRIAYGISAAEFGLTDQLLSQASAQLRATDADSLTTIIQQLDEQAENARESKTEQLKRCESIWVPHLTATMRLYEGSDEERPKRK